MNRRFLLALAGAVFFGLLSIYAAQIYLRKQVASERAKDETEVVIATTDIPLGTQISELQIAVVRYPKKILPEKTLVRREEVLGRVAVVDISAKTPILEKQLAGIGAQPGLPGVTPAGMRAVSVRVDEASSVGGFVSPGSYVDVIAIMQPQIDGAKQVSKVILQKVRVLAGGQQMQNKPDGKPALVNTVTLEVTPNQAEKLKLAEAEGRLQLSIRNATDQIIETTRGATRRDVINDIALERRALEGARNTGFGARPGPTPPPFNINFSGLNQPAQTTPVKKVGPIGPTIELIEGAKRTRVEMIP
ncbi:MAG: Flp pilus assembly protein CpaB [Acidobacteria bacterium]|nr:Flp pilus assembly protein CpaB [Acidobacteriota bacterium]MCI0662963.1 Flp pilus assembly protein CpaB [Acidobacteriota bacterium]